MKFEKFIGKYLLFEHFLKIIAPIGISYQVIKPNSTIEYVGTIILTIVLLRTFEKYLEKAYKIGQ